MKIRITESQLRKLIRESIYEVGDVEEPAMSDVSPIKKKIINKNKFNGNYEQLYSGEGVEAVPSFIVVVNNFTNRDTFDEFAEFASDRIVKGGVNQSYDKGIGYFSARLEGTINQLFGVPIYADTYTPRNSSVSDIQQDPIEFTYSPLSKGKCPLEIDDYGYVHPRQGTEELFKDFEVYKRGLVNWSLSTAHPDKGEVIFFFDDVADKNTFVRAIKNMFMIAEHTVKNGKTVYSFKAAQNPQLNITEYGGEGGVDPIGFLDQSQDADIIEAINGILKGQQDSKDQSERMIDPEYLEQKAREEEEERYRRASQVIDAHGPSFLSSTPSLARNNGGTVDESTLARMIKESIIKALNEKH